MKRPNLRTLAFGAWLSGLLCAPAAAGVQDWELSELYRGSDPQIRFIELVNLAGGCLFPSSRVDLFDAQGLLTSSHALTVATACHGAPTYIVLASAEAAAAFGVSRDGNLNSELPASGQLCFRSSATYYDCVRWGNVSDPIVDLFGATDTSAASSPALNRSLARSQSTHIVIDDWIEQDPTPRQPNNGGVWDPPDAGLPPDAAPIVDAGPPGDARRRSDAGRSETSDAGNNRYLDLDPVGGGGCGCQTQQGAGPGAILLLLLSFLGLRRRSKLA